ncbi:MAG: 2Fe-2S iron-sulfur cluster-binding protein [Bacteroidota bacterium]
MPKITFKGKTITCVQGANLRKVLLKHHLSPHNGASTLLNCKGFGSCGTCAVYIEGDTNEKTMMEKWRLSFPPHQPKARLRLACQCKVDGDLELKKYDGFWGQGEREIE